MAAVRDPYPPISTARMGEDPVVAAADTAARAVANRAEGEAYVASICFKHGPPRLTGVELEYVVHHTTDPYRRVEPPSLARALAPHAPRTIDPHSPAEPLPNGSTLTVEPGGQVEISTPPRDSLPELAAVTDADLGYLTDMLARAGLRLGHTGIDAFRPPRRLLTTERYAAMERRFAPMGSAGLTMMCSTAALQVCLDIGEPADIGLRWATAHALGPVLLALFANSTRHAGRDTGCASARWLAVQGTESSRTRAAAVTADPAAEWSRRVLDTPLMVLRRPDGAWDAPPGVSFADWVEGRGPAELPGSPTVEDLEYHLGTMFTPVRARGYLELRFLDAQPPETWLHPVALLHALFTGRATMESALRCCAPAADRWESAARLGLADPVLRRAARAVTRLGCAELSRTGLDQHTIDEVAEGVQRRLHGIGERS